MSHGFKKCPGDICEAEEVRRDQKSGTTNPDDVILESFDRSSHWSQTGGAVLMKGVGGGRFFTGTSLAGARSGHSGILWTSYGADVRGFAQTWREVRAPGD